MSVSLISVQPAEQLLFNPETQTAALQIENVTQERLVFRIKIKVPGVFSVTPSAGDIDPRATAEVKIKFKDADTSEDKVRKHKFQVIATAVDGREQSVVLGMVFEKEESVSRFVTGVFQDDPVEDPEKTRANMQDLQDQSLKMTKEIDRMKMEISKIEHQLRFRGESKLQMVDASSGYTVFHLVLGFLVGLLLAAIIR